jgi:hypothetical protein
MTQKALPQPEATPAEQLAARRQAEEQLRLAAGAQFTCFTTTRTKVLALLQSEEQVRRAAGVKALLRLY